MAKAKRAAALFEVIHTGRDKPAPLFNSARSWFGRRSRKDDPTLAPIERTVTERTAAEAEIASAPIVRDPVEDSTIDVAVPHASGMDVQFDSERQLITFRLSYSSACIIGFALAMTIVLAYLVGNKMSRSPVLAIATQTTEQLRAKPPHPEVMNLAPKNSAGGGNQIVGVVPEADNGTSSRNNDVANDKSDAANSTAQRSVNLNYLVIQSYPDEKSAEDARDSLLKAGVGCTVEQKLRGLNPTWFTVVGTQGFSRISSDEYKSYIVKLDQISQQFAQNKRSFKAFQPMAYKWDRASNATASSENQ